LAQSNVHGTVLVIGDRGVLITGDSGSGKTTLALLLLREWQACGRFARLVADDQLFVAAQSGRLIVSAPPAIAGLAEVRGLGPRSLAHHSSALIDLVVRLVPVVAAPRLADPQTVTIEGFALPLLVLPARDAVASALAVTAWLKAPPFR
jgi:serine kinase of HPr protein (carbohydrate metabolism regulator)